MDSSVVSEPTTNLVEALFSQAGKYAERVAYRADGGKGKTFTYAEVMRVVARTANGLRGDELLNQHDIGLLSGNRPEWCLAYLSIIAAGKTVVPIDPGLKESEIRFILEHSGVKTLFASPRMEKFICERFPSVRVFSFDESSSSSWIQLQTDEERINRAANEVAALIYTSGTTGDPKGVQLTHRNLIANLESIQQTLLFDSTDVFLSVLPLHHTFEATCGFLAPFVSGSSVVYARSLKSKEILEDIAANNVTLMCGVPLLYEKMYNAIRRGIDSAPVLRRMLFRVLFIVSSVGWKAGISFGKQLFKGMRERVGLGSIRMFVSGGAPLPPAINQFFNLIGFDFVQGYGMTECSPVISVNRPESISFDSVGPPLPGVEVRIHDQNDDGVGEIIVRGANVTSGYRNKPEQTAELIKDGWLYTGDLGRLYGGHLVITGRRKNLIVSAAGKNIYPEQIEERLKESRYVLEAVVFGRKKQSNLGEEVCAIVVPDLEQFKTEGLVTDSEEQLETIQQVIADEVAKTNENMADYKRISSFETRLQELEKTSTRKVKRYIYR